MKRVQLFDNPPYMRAHLEVIGRDIWTFVETGPAVMVLPVRKTQTGLEVLLIEEQRPLGLMLKAVGGYLGKKSPDKKAEILLLEEAGVKTSGIWGIYSKMIGFEVVKLPIVAFIANDWQIVKDGKGERVVLSLEDAVRRVLDNEVGDQCTADAIMRLSILVNQFPSRLPEFLR